MDEKYKSLFNKYNEQLIVKEHLKEIIRKTKRQLNKNEQKYLKKNV